VEAPNFGNRDSSPPSLCLWINTHKVLEPTSKSLAAAFNEQVPLSTNARAARTINLRRSKRNARRISGASNRKNCHEVGSTNLTERLRIARLPRGRGGRFAAMSPTVEEGRDGPFPRAATMCALCILERPASLERNAAA